MNIMTGYLGATSGTVTIDGIDITQDPEEAKRHIGYLPEHPPLYTDMTVEEYMDFAAAIKGIKKAERKNEVESVMERTEISDVSDRLIRNLSKGYQQRIGIAQALLGSPEFIILDEPTVGLDPAQIIEIRNLIRGLSKDHTVMLSTHILSEVQEVCDHILIIHHGHKAACGTEAELEKDASINAPVEVTLRAFESKGLEVLKTVPGVASIDTVPSKEENTSSFRLTREAGKDIRDDLFFACAKAGIPILALKSNASLEDIFLQLTSSETAEASEEEPDACADSEKESTDQPEAETKPEDEPKADSEQNPASEKKG